MPIYRTISSMVSYYFRETCGPPQFTGPWAISAQKPRMRCFFALMRFSCDAQRLWTKPRPVNFVSSVLERRHEKKIQRNIERSYFAVSGKSPCVWCGRCSGFIRSVFTETVLTWFYNPPALFAGHGSVVAVVDLLLRLIRWVRGFTGGMPPQVLSICLVFQRFIRVVKLNRL